MDLALKNVPRNRSADQRGRDVIEEARQHKHQEKQRDAARPVVRKQGGHLIGNSALLEVPGQKCKSHQQQEQIGQHHPFVRHMLAKAAESRAEFESGEGQLVNNDGGEPRQRHRKRVTMEQRHAEQGQREKNEINGYSEESYGFDHSSLGCWEISAGLCSNSVSSAPSASRRFR